VPPPETIRVLLVDDHAMVREGIAHTLAEQEGFEVAYCGNIADALDRLQSSPADLLLLDYDLGSERATDLLRRMDGVGFHGPTVILTAHINNHAARRLIQMGVSGIMLKTESLSILGSRLREIMAGGKWLDEEIAKDLYRLDNAETPRWEFTYREREMLGDIVTGLSNKEIAFKHDISESAVKATIQSLFRKTGVRTRSQLVRVGLEREL
jgi:two-component system, NarL family, nitrate/nitrite response regulator NarL